MITVCKSSGAYEYYVSGTQKQLILEAPKALTKIWADADGATRKKLEAIWSNASKTAINHFNKVIAK